MTTGSMVLRELGLDAWPRRRRWSRRRRPWHLRRRLAWRRRGRRRRPAESESGAAGARCGARRCGGGAVVSKTGEGSGTSGWCSMLLRRAKARRAAWHRAAHRRRHRHGSASSAGRGAGATETAVAPRVSGTVCAATAATVIGAAGTAAFGPAAALVLLEWREGRTRGRLRGRLRCGAARRCRMMRGADGARRCGTLRSTPADAG